MWTCISAPQLNPDGILELLRRSGSALLNVFLEFDSEVCDSELEHESTSNMFSTLFQQIHRFKALYVYVFSKYCFSWSPKVVAEASIRQILPYLQRPAPKLQSFCFKHVEFLVSEAKLDETFLDTLFSGETPNLKCIHRELFDGALRQLQPNPLIRDLSELHLTMVDNSSRVDSDLLLDYFELSPCLKLFSFQVFCDPDGNMISATCPRRDRKINLPHLQKLVLNVDFAVELLDVIFNHLSFPSNIEWKVVSEPVELGTSPQLLQLLSQAQFTSLHISFDNEGMVTFSFTKCCNPPCLGLVNDHELVFIQNDLCPISDYWHLLWQSVKPSDITHLGFYFEGRIDRPKPATFQTIFTSLKNLETLFVRQYCDYWHSEPDKESCLVCLSALIPISKDSTISESGSGIMNLKTSFPCPLLREIFVDLKKSLDRRHAAVFPVFCDRRREAGYPLRFSVRCIKIEEDAQRLEDNSSINFVSIVPRSSMTR